MKLTEIIGLDQKHATLLEKAGIRETEDLLPLTYYQIQQMARSIGVSVKTLDTWQEHVDLMRIEGITPQLANAINLVGIDSVKEFSRRNVKTTVTKLKQLKSGDAKILAKVPTEKEVQKWKDQAISLEGTPSKKPSKPGKPKKPGKTPAKTPSSDLPVQPKLIKIKPFEKDYGEFGPGYWNTKWKEAPIIYTGRALRGKSYKKQIDADVKVFIKKNDAILHHVISQLDLYKETANETAWAIQKFVCNFLKYTDDVAVDCPEYWLFPFEAIQSEIGDCEDGAILIASLLINAGIPAWRVKVCAAQVMADPIFAPADEGGELGGHAYCIYLADRPESDKKLEWVILDWCYMRDPDVPIEKKPLANDGGQGGAYRNIWFTFNNEKSWAQTAFEVTSARISKGRTTKMEDVIAELGDITRILAEEEVEKLLDKLNFVVE